eukprot:905651-Prymnesium_polylepis.1
MVFCVIEISFSSIRTAVASSLTDLGILLRDSLCEIHPGSLQMPTASENGVCLKSTLCAMASSKRVTSLDEETFARRSHASSLDPAIKMTSFGMTLTSLVTEIPMRAISTILSNDPVPSSLCVEVCTSGTTLPRKAKHTRLL